MLHIPSPDWRDQVIYFVLTDRFDDGNPRNNDQGAGEYDPKRHDRYSGGDFEGVRRRLDYIQGLGATAIWVTPPYANMWLNADGSYAGYHGYWPQHFMKVDPHLGTLQDYRRLSDALHRRGMRLVQDIVVNHVGDFFHYGPGHDPARPQTDWRPNRGTRPTAAPTQFPFSLNDPRRSRDRAVGAYHWTPDIRDYRQPDQVLTHQMSGLDDLNTENPIVREALRRSHAYWIREVGVDAFRVDTAFYVPPDFFEDFIWRPARAGGTPGMAAVARQTGRQDFLLFGEGFGIDPRGEDAQARRIEAYMNGPHGQRRMQGMLNFGLYGVLGDVFARGAPTAALGERVRELVRQHPRLHWMPSFVDNHDVDRFLAGADERALRQALAALFTLPGIPVIYYGTEQGFTLQRGAMFASGWGSGGRDRFDTGHPLYGAIRELAALRRDHAALRRGTPVILAESQGEAGVIAWRMSHEGRHVLVALNTSDDTARVTGLNTGQAGAATPLRALWSLEGWAQDVAVSANGRAALTLPPRSAAAWAWEGPLQPDADAEAPIRIADAATSSAPWQLRASVDDPAGDDAGPAGRYVYPREPAFAQLRTADMRQIRVYTQTQEREGRPAEALRVEVDMAALSRSWNPQNGFDRVAFTLFLELPDQDGGVRVMPLQDGELPGDMRWHRRLRAHGWSLALFDTQGATAGHEGRPVHRGARVQTDAERKTVTFTLSPATLGWPTSLRGARLLINTWDYDGAYRALQATPGDYAFGGGTPGEPKWMDQSPVITLP